MGRKSGRCPGEHPRQDKLSRSAILLPGEAKNGAAQETFIPFAALPPRVMSYASNDTLNGQRDHLPPRG